jgi:LysM repeat protein
MATPMSATEFIAALRAEGCKVVEVGDWTHHNRNSKGPWGPVNGVVIHHTVTKGSASTVAICRDGYTALPGPLCHGVITKDGQVHLVGYGRANHAGGGDPAVLTQVVDESYGTRPTPPTKGNLDGTDGNRHFYGFECENLGDGKDPWPAAQLLAIEQVGAAICRHHKWSDKSVIGHLEWSDDKSDPRGFTMASMRARVAVRLKPKPATYTVEPNDTLSKIGTELGVPWTAIAATNNIKTPYRITPGQVLKIPKK